MPALPLVGLIAGVALVTGVVLPPSRFRRVAAGLLVAMVGAGSLRVGLGTDRADLLATMAGQPSGGRGFLQIGLILLFLGGLIALGLGFFPAHAGPLRVEPPPTLRRGGLQWVVPLLGLVALVSPSVPLMFGALYLAGGIELLLPERTARVRVLLGVRLLLLAAAGYLLATIIGPIPATYTALRDGPIGEPAARLLLMLLFLPIMIDLGWWPLILSGGALLARFSSELLPGGIHFWQAAGMPVALIAAGYFASRWRPVETTAMVGAFGLWADTAMGRWGGALLVVAALALPPVMRIGAVGVAGRLQRLVFAVAGTGLLLVVAGGLEVQVAYSLLLAASAGVLLFVSLPERPATVASS